MRLPVSLRPARAADLQTRHLPDLPEWYPLDPKPTDEQPHPERYTERQRRELRQAKRRDEAVRGPYDGQRGMVVEFVPEQGPPTVWQPLQTPGVLYRLSKAESDDTQVVYRYDLDCPLHRPSMAAVADAYREHGQDYAISAREEEADDRTAPTL